MPRCGCGSTGACDCWLRGGTGIRVSGQGTDFDPYTITFIGTQEGNTELLHGVGPPPDTFGSQGDFYIDTLNWRIYGPKAATGWTGGSTSMVGPSGQPGPTGPAGPAGNAGVLVLAAAAPVPPGTAAGTIILRTAT